MEPTTTSKPVWGLELRYVLTVALLDRDREMTLAELISVVEAQGFSIGGRPSKTASDALR